MCQARILLVSASFQASGVPKALNTLDFYHHQAGVNPFYFDNKTPAGFQSCLKMCLSVKSWMASYEKLIHFYDTVTNLSEQQGWYVHNPKTYLLIMSSSCYSLTSVFRSCLSTSVAAIPPTHLSTISRGKGPEVAHPVPGLLPHGLSSPALHGWSVASEACLLTFGLAVRIFIGGPSAVEGLVGWSRLNSFISSIFLWGICLAHTWWLMARESEPELL